MNFFAYPETSNADFSFLMEFFFSKKPITSLFSFLMNFFFSKKLFLIFHVPQNKFFSSRNFERKIKFLERNFFHLETLILKNRFITPPGHLIKTDCGLQSKRFTLHVNLFTPISMVVHILLPLKLSVNVQL